MSKVPWAMREYPKANIVTPPSCGGDPQRTPKAQSEISAPVVNTGNQVKGGGIRHNTSKLPVHLVPPSTVRAIAKVLKAGMDKPNPYPERNWELGMSWTTVYASLLRHLMDWMDGEDYDKETGLLQVEHILTNASFLVEYAKTCPELDDRPKKRAP